MNPTPIKAYHFTTDAQWRTCLLHRFDRLSDGSMKPIARFGLTATRVTRHGPVATVAADSQGNPTWRVGNALFEFDALETVAEPFEIGGTLSTSPRWILDRHWLWAFDRAPARLCRYDRETLELDLALDIAALLDDETASPVLLDIAGDGHEGAWLLVRLGAAGETLLHLDCAGKLQERREPPCKTGPFSQIGTVASGQTLLLLREDGTAFWILDVVGAKAPWRFALGGLAPCWRAARLAADGRNRFALLGRQDPGAAGNWSVYVFDGGADLLDGPIQGIFPAGATPPLDIAIARTTLWLAAADGLYRLDPGGGAGERETESTLLTPALDSPPSGDTRGWLRAEVSIDLPRGAVLIADYASTDDTHVADRVRRIAGDASVSAEARQQSIWSLLDPPATNRMEIAGPSTPGLPVAIPLFESQDEWLWLRLTVIVPPGTQAPAIKGLRVLYPDFSLTQYLPSIFRGANYDPRGFLRRLVGVLETTTQDIDERIRRIGRNIDPATAPADWLDYLGRWLDLPWDDALPEASKRCLLRHAAELQRERGTRRGLEQLLRCLVGKGGTVVLRDRTVDHTVLRLGGDGCPGQALPALLAGMSTRIAAFNGKSALGRVRLSCSPRDCDPLGTVAPGLTILLSAPRKTRLAIEPLAAGIIAQFIPAGLALAIRWQVLAELPEGVGPADELLDANGTATLGFDSVIGRTVLAGHGTGRISETGLDLGFRL